MYKFRVSPLLIVLLFLLIPLSLNAYYRDKSSDIDDRPQVRQVIIKLSANSKIELSDGAEGPAKIGIPSVDAIGAKYSITRMKMLLPKKVNDACPQNLKNLIIVQLSDKSDLSAILSEYENSPMVEYAEPDWPMSLYEAPDDSLYGEQWALNNTGQGCRSVFRLPYVGDDTLGIIYGTPGADIDYQDVYDNPPDQTETVVVAIIDTGVDTEHPDLAGHIWVNPHEIPNNGIDDDHNGYIDDIHGWDFCGDNSAFPPSPDNDITDPHGHGTHCSGIVAAITDNLNGIAGINFDCRVMGLKFYPYMFTSYAISAIVYAADNGADVINMSWGLPWISSSLEGALNYARSKGVVLCAASGNDGAEVYNYPASFPGIITVGATQWEDQVTTFSTYGDHINISAPGQSILSLRAANTDMYDKEPGVHIIDDIYYLASGTSMACPHTVGVAAFMRSMSPGLTPDAAERIIEESADDLVDPYGNGGNYPGWDKYSGYGRINLYNALNMSPQVRAIIETPSCNSMVLGDVDITGTADGDDFVDYTIEYGDGRSPTAWTEIASSTSPVTHGFITQWNTSGLNGVYTLRLVVGEDNISMVTVVVTNDVLVEISDPVSGDTITTSRSVFGTASCPGFDHFVLDFRPSDSVDSWKEIEHSNVSIHNDKLAEWVTDTISGEWFYLRLRIFADSGQTGVDSELIYIQSLFSIPGNWILNNDVDVTPYPNFCDVDQDGTEEIILGRDGDVLFINPDGTIKTEGIPQLPAGNYRIPAAVGNLDNDKYYDFVICNKTHIYGFPSSGSPFTIGLTYQPSIGDLDAGEDYRFPYVALKDIDSDGMDEILYYSGTNSFSPRFHLYESDGTPIVKIPGGYSAFMSADLDGDGTDEIYMSDIRIYQADFTGTISNSFDLASVNSDFKSCLYLSAADIDSDGKHELIAMALGYVHFWLYAFDENLTLKDSWPRNTLISSLSVPPSPLFVDIDRDGSLEYFISLYDLDDGFVYGWRIDGSPFSGDSLNPIFSAPPFPSRVYNPVITDIDGDDYPDIVVNAGASVMCTNELNRLIAWNKDTELIDGWPLTIAYDNCAHLRRFMPVIGDINGDGDVDIMTTTLNNDLMFVSLNGNPYSEAATPVPFWRYNRKVNNCGPLAITDAACGDINYDGIINIFDITFTIEYLYLDGAPPVDLDLADVNDDGAVNIFDIVYIIQYLYLEGTDPNCG